MARNNLSVRRFFSKKNIITIDSKEFAGAIEDVKDNSLHLEFRPVCVHEERPLGDWTTDEDEADRIASAHRIQNKHATTVQIRN